MTKAYDGTLPYVYNKPTDPAVPVAYLVSADVLLPILPVYHH